MTTPTPTTHGGQFVDGALVHQTDNRGVPGEEQPAPQTSAGNPPADPRRPRPRRSREEA